MKLIYGVGVNDIQNGFASHKEENKENRRKYNLWVKMLERCYSKKHHEKYPTYKDCYVCDKWLKLSGFLDDLPKINGYEEWLNNPGKYALDKDIKSNGKNKCYCLENCIFVTHTNNSIQANKTRDYSNISGENNYWYKNNNLIKGENNPNYGNHKLAGKNHPKSKKVAQYDLDGNLIRIWDYAKQVSEELQISYGVLKQHLNKKCKKEDYKGFIWKYVDDVEF